jgi:hypothetical protein
VATYTYSYTALNNPFDIYGTVAQGINDSGEIVGWYQQLGAGGVNEYYGFVYSGGQLHHA